MAAPVPDISARRGLRRGTSAVIARRAAWMIVLTDHVVGLVRWGRCGRGGRALRGGAGRGLCWHVPVAASSPRTGPVSWPCKQAHARAGAPSWVGGRAQLPGRGRDSGARWCPQPGCGRMARPGNAAPFSRPSWMPRARAWRRGAGSCAGTRPGLAAGCPSCGRVAACLALPVHGLCVVVWQVFHDLGGATWLDRDVFGSHPEIRGRPGTFDPGRAGGVVGGPCGGGAAARPGRLWPRMSWRAGLGRHHRCRHRPFSPVRTGPGARTPGCGGDSDGAAARHRRGRGGRGWGAGSWRLAGVLAETGWAWAHLAAADLGPGCIGPAAASPHIHARSGASPWDQCCYRTCRRP